METRLRARRFAVAIIIAIVAGVFVASNENFWQMQSPNTQQTLGVQATKPASGQAAAILNTLAVKGRAPKTNYSRDQFGGEWTDIDGTCDARNVILHRDLVDVKMNAKCQVVSGVLHDPYTGKTINFVRGASTSSAIQIDHVVAVSDAWQTGAQQLTLNERKAMYVDPLELLAVDGPANNQKSDGDAATWLPPNKAFRCQYVARQIAVKAKYHLWVTSAEKQAIVTILSNCPGQKIPDGALGRQS